MTNDGGKINFLSHAKSYTMEYRRLGKSGLQLSVVSYGSWTTFHHQVDEHLADTLMGYAYDQGINFFDNAESYAGGESEKLMGRVLKQKRWERSSYVLSSKVFFGWHGKENKPNQHGLSRKHIIEACHEALQRLQVDYLDLYFCHRPDPQTPVSEVVWAMNHLLQQGKILYWGTSEWSAAQIMEAHMIAERYGLIGPTMEQPQYNLFYREKVEKEFLPLYESIGLGTTTWSPLASGLLTGKYNAGIPRDSRLGLPGYEWLKEKLLIPQNIEKVKALQKMADAYGVSLAVLAIAWCIRNPHVSTVILGASRLSQLEENMQAVQFYHQLQDEILQQIEAIVDNKPHE